jgi:hypothetical protein
MMERLTSWLKERLGWEDPDPAPTLHRTGTFTSRPNKPAAKKPDADSVELDTHVSGKIEDAGPGKNVLIRNKYIREDTGTHETLKILDDSLIDSGEEAGIDPYNTGSFDRSNNWNNRFRK